ncbi:LacI family DNA-binding transcriptional regulator [Roseateles sp. BYS96W]|uniref:LacI family DNA-binding transcriptional regulator n=1 Tax=Pelomonas nitida TaxID=3299027 RepID=A0ABW7G6Z5_9BURK
MATIKDVARLAGVGVGTASRVISGHGAVAPATAERVREVIAQLKFRPSHAARTLGNGRSRLIGVYIPFLRGTYYTPILSAIDLTLRGHGLHMVVAFGEGLGDERAEANEGMRFLLDRDCDGLVVMSNALQDADLRALGPAARQVVVLNRHFDRFKAQCFTADHTQGGAHAARALLQHRHQHIAVVAGPATSPDNVARLAGFMAELAAHGVSAGNVVTVPGDFSNQAGWDAAQALLALKKRPTAVFCANDEMAIGLLAHFQERGVAVPHDASVLGYDDTPSAAFAAPRLTSVHIPSHAVTQAGVHWLLNRCYGMALPVSRRFDISVTWRASVAGPPAKRRS